MQPARRLQPIAGRSGRCAGRSGPRARFLRPSFPVHRVACSGAFRRGPAIRRAGTRLFQIAPPSTVVCTTPARPPDTARRRAGSGPPALLLARGHATQARYITQTHASRARYRQILVHDQSEASLPPPRIRASAFWSCNVRFDTIWTNFRVRLRRFLARNCVQSLLLAQYQSYRSHCKPIMNSTVKHDKLHCTSSWRLLRLATDARSGARCVPP